VLPEHYWLVTQTFADTYCWYVFRMMLCFVVSETDICGGQLLIHLQKPGKI